MREKRGRSVVSEASFKLINRTDRRTREVHYDAFQFGCKAAAFPLISFLRQQQQSRSGLEIGFAIEAITIEDASHWRFLTFRD